MKQNLMRLAASLLVAVVALAAAPAFAADAPAGVVNVNTASATELAYLPGVGPALAGRIVQHREKNGNFKTAEDLMLVKGIGEKSFERMKPYVAVAGATTLAADIKSPRAKKTDAKPDEKSKG